MVEEALERILRRIRQTASGCWEWTGQLQNRGYGVFSFRGRPWLVHRWTYIHLVGPIPDGKEIDHLCRNRACCNPAHMEPVTRRENCLRGARSGPRSRCRRGHRLVAGNVYVGRRGTRLCKTCHLARCKRYYLQRVGRYTRSKPEAQVEFGGKVGNRGGRGTHCRMGHPLTPENTAAKPNGGRVCLTCRRRRDRLWRKARRRMVRTG